MRFPVSVQLPVKVSKLGELAMQKSPASVNGLARVRENPLAPSAPPNCVFCCIVTVPLDNAVLLPNWTSPEPIVVEPVYVLGAYSATVPLLSISRPLLPEMTPADETPSVPICKMPPPLLEITPVAAPKFRLQVMTALFAAGNRLVYGTTARAVPVPAPVWFGRSE